MKTVFLLLLLVTTNAFSQDTLRPTPNLIAEGIPPITSDLAESIRPYSEFRTAGFVAWHPVEKSMLIATRFANTNQLHKVNMPLGARKQLTFFAEPVGFATYQPVNGDYFLYTRDIGGNEFAQIYRYDLKSGKSTLLTDGKRSQNGGIVWSHSGKRIAYSSTSRNGADRDIYLTDPLKPESNKLLLQTTGGGWNVTDWSRDEKQLILSEYISANESHFWLVDATTGQKSELTNRSDKSVSNRQASFAKSGNGVYFVTDKDNEFGRLAYMDLSTKALQYLTSNINWDVDGYDQSEDGKHIAFIANEAGASKLYMMNTKDHSYKQVADLPLGVYSSPRFHNNNTDIAITIASAQSPSDVFVLNVLTNKLERWTESEIGGINVSQLRSPELIKWTSSDDKEISGFYYKPDARFTGKRPVIINIHGGPEGQYRPGFQGASNYYLNELGAAIIYPNVRGSSGYGKTFLASDNGFKREESVKDIGALLDWIAKQPDLDANRVMVTGGSYGGYMTLAVAVTYADRIRCALDVVGISHFGTFLKNTESYRRDLRRVEYGDERDPEMAAFFEKISPLNNAGKITKPMFIVQGGNDPRVPRTEAVQMAEKIRMNKGTVWYLEAKDEGHGFSKKNNQDFQRYATVLFMQRYLLGDMRSN